MGLAHVAHSSLNQGSACGTHKYPTLVTFPCSLELDRLAFGSFNRDSPMWGFEATSGQRQLRTELGPDPATSRREARTRADGKMFHKLCQ